MEEKFLSPKEVASLLGISLATVNYYTNLGLLPAQERRGNMRLYRKKTILEKFAKIKELRSRGYSLNLISRQFHS